MSLQGVWSGMLTCVAGDALPTAASVWGLTGYSATCLASKLSETLLLFRVGLADATAESSEPRMEPPQLTQVAFSCNFLCCARQGLPTLETGSCLGCTGQYRHGGSRGPLSQTRP